MAVSKWTASDRRTSQAIALLRIVVGACFLYAGYAKYSDPMFSAHLPSLLKTWAKSNPVFIYQDVMNLLIVPQAKALAFVITWLEMAVGTAMILGVGMRYVLWAQVFLLLNYLAASQHIEPALLVINVLFLAMAVICYWGQAGRHYGLDAWLEGLTAPKSRKKKSTGGSARSAKKRLKKVVALEPLFQERNRDDEDEEAFDWDLDDDDDDDEEELPVRRRGARNRRKAAAR